MGRRTTCCALHGCLAAPPRRYHELTCTITELSQTHCHSIQNTVRLATTALCDRMVQAAQPRARHHQQDAVTSSCTHTRSCSCASACPDPDSYTGTATAADLTARQHHRALLTPSALSRALSPTTHKHPTGHMACILRMHTSHSVPTTLLLF
jgi:hypothetical protein